MPATATRDSKVVLGTLGDQPITHGLTGRRCRTYVRILGPEASSRERTGSEWKTLAFIVSERNGNLGMAAAGLRDQRVGRFRLVERLDEGSTGAVFVASPNGAAGRTVALKVIHPDVVVQPGFARRLDRDVRTVSALSDAHILPVFEYGASGDTTYVVTPLAVGGSLRDKLSGGPLDAGTAWEILRTVGRALHRAHEAGVVHMDVKPANVLFDDYAKALLADFGVTRTHLGFAMGTPGYMAPEQATGQKADRRADVYGLAVVAFEMLTGTPPYSAGSVPELLRATTSAPIPSARDRYHEVPSGFDAALYRGLAKAPDHRYQTVLELLWAIGRVLGRQPPSRPTHPTRAPRTFVLSLAPGPGHQNRAWMAFPAVSQQSEADAGNGNVRPADEGDGSVSARKPGG